MVTALIVYSIIVILTGVYSYFRNDKSEDEYLVCGRKQGWVSSGLSIAATWIWAPAMFVSAQQAYEGGISGFFWFFVPNVLTVLIFGNIAGKLRRKFPNGYTLPQFMDSIYGGRVHKLYLFQFVLLQVMAMAVQLLAGGKMISLMTGWNYHYVVIWLAVLAFTYSAMGGLRSSILTDVIQMIFMIVAGVLAVVTVVKSTGAQAVMAGVRPSGAKFVSVMLTTGITTSIGLIAGPVGDQMFWQRVFAVKEGGIKKTFVLGAIAFSVIPISFGIIGFAGAGLGFVASSPDMVGIEMVRTYAPAIIYILTALLITAGLSSTMDSGFAAISSLAIVDISKYKKMGSVSSMAILALLSMGIAFIPNLKIFNLFLFYGTVRATTLIPTLVTILSKHIPDEKYVRIGLICSLSIGVPVYVIGCISGQWAINLIGIILTVGLAGAFTLKGVIDENRKIESI